MGRQVSLLHNKASGKAAAGTIVNGDIENIPFQVTIKHESASPLCCLSTLLTTLANGSGQLGRWLWDRACCVSVGPECISTSRVPTARWGVDAGESLKVKDQPAWCTPWRTMTGHSFKAGWMVRANT